MIGPMERALFLRALQPLGGLAQQDVPVLAEHARERTFRAGEALYRDGLRPRSFQIIVEGSVHARGGEYLDGADLGSRDSVAFLSILAARDEGINAVAKEDVVALEFEDEVFYDILEDNFEIANTIIRQLAGATLRVRRQVPSGSYFAPDEGKLDVPDRPLNLVERILMLRRPGSPFMNASLDAITQIARTIRQVSYPAGHTIWKTGDRSDAAYIILSGTVACTTQWGLSRFRAGPGYPLGNLERFSRDPRWYTAITETPCRCVVNETEALLDVFEDNFDMTLGFLRAMARRVISISEEAGSVARPVAAGSTT
ncbi:MAG: cyclic nucleotide-binding domain-containing protein [Gemmatimonadetes bacterium]|nr:cyclic nucleotide-binding domain-containing protein [Gemmatimonadota bacterium]